MEPTNNLKILLSWKIGGFSDAIKVEELATKIGGFAQILTLGLVALEARGPPHQDVLQGGLHHLIGLVEAAGLVLLGVGGPEGEEEEEEAVEEVRPHG